MSLFRTFFLSVLLLIGSFGQTQNLTKVGNNVISVGTNLISIPTPANAFLPSDVAGLAVWLRADFGVTTSGGSVSQWDLKNGTFRAVSNITQATGTNQPTHIVSDVAYNNQSTISFVTNDYLDAVAFSTAIAKPLTIFYIGNVGGNQQIFDDLGGTRVRMYGAGGSMYANAGASRTFGARDNNPHIYEIKFNGSVSETMLDGVVKSTGNAGSNSFNRIRIGANITPGAYLNGKFAEFIIYDALVSDADRLLIRNYLSTRYSITLP